MRIRFHGPFERLAGREVQMDVEGSVTLRQLLGYLADRFAGFALYTAKTTDEDLSAHVMFVRKGKHLKLGDTIENDDTLNVYLPVTGG